MWAGVIGNLLEKLWVVPAGVVPPVVKAEPIAEVASTLKV